MRRTLFRSLFVVAISLQDFSAMALAQDTNRCRFSRRNAGNCVLTAGRFAPIGERFAGTSRDQAGPPRNQIGCARVSSGPARRSVTAGTAGGPT